MVALPVFSAAHVNKYLIVSTPSLHISKYNTTPRHDIPSFGDNTENCAPCGMIPTRSVNQIRI